MLRSSLPLGRYFNVDVRMHMSFPLLLIFSVALSGLTHGGPGRGLLLWLALCFAVLVREVARAIAAAYAGLQLRAIYLLPIGGVMAFRAPDGPGLQTSVFGMRDTRWVNAIGPIANFAIGWLMLGFSLAVDPRALLFAQPWIGLGHLLRSFIWIQLLVGVVSLLPTLVLPTRKLLRFTKAPIVHPNANPAANLTTDLTAKSTKGSLPTFGPGTALAICMIIAGFLLPDAYFLSGLGVFLLLYVQISGQHTQAATDGDVILVREVMLTEYSLLSSSDTLRDALDRTVHSLQDIFPVVRGDRLVGSIARQTIAERLLTDGDSYLQGAMMRSLQIATPDEKLLDALRRAASLGASEFIPVVENNAMIGILTPQSLARAVQQVKLLRPSTPQQGQR